MHGNIYSGSGTSLFIPIAEIHKFCFIFEMVIIKWSNTQDVGANASASSKVLDDTQSMESDADDASD